jgi:DNA gyrase subunit A
MLITLQGMVTRSHVGGPRGIRIVGRNTQGVRIMDLNEGDKIVSFAKVAREEEETAAEAPKAAEEKPGEEPKPE